eukprot:gi/632972773/ref/XP_007902824.1/ PREDICTED: tyrosine-protein phosphatase non-receptor type substrate 1-like [Callorhinchus milii]
MMPSAIFPLLSLIQIISTVIGNNMNVVTQYPKFQTPNNGANITFHCIFAVAPTNVRINVYWWKHGESGYLQTKEDKRQIFGLEHGRGGGFFHLLDVRVKDTGVYHCALIREGKTAGNGTGSHLTVCVSPTSVKIFPRDLRNGSANLTLVCETDGFYPDNLNLTWYKNGTEMATGVNTTIQQISNGLYEASSSVEEIEAVQNGVVYTCQVSHLSLQTPVIANYTVVLPDIRSDTLSPYLLIAGYAGGGLAFLVLIIIIAKGSQLRKMRGSHGVVNGSDHPEEEEARTEMVSYATLDLTGSQKTRRPKHQEERTVYSETKHGAASNKMTYATLDLSSSQGNGKPKCSNKNTEYAQLQTTQAAGGNKLTYVAPDLARSKKMKKAKCNKDAEYAEVQVGANRAAVEATFN